MAAKPDVALARFATGPGEDTVAPGSSLRDTGFVAGTPVVQSYVNELLNQLYQWALYLDEGELEGDHVIDGALEVTGASTLTGGIAGDLDVTGGLTVGGDLEVTGDIAHGTMKEAFAPVIVNNAVGLTWQLNTGDFVTSTGSGAAQFSVPCRVGDRITGIEVLAFGDGAVDATITLDYLDSSMSATNMATLADDNRAAAWGFAIPTVTPHTIADGERLRLTVNANAANYRVGQIKLIYDRPPP